MRQRWHPGQPAFDLIVAGDLVCICAWCRRAHTRDDQWVLLADFRPPNPMRVTHVICDSCRERNFGV